MNERIKELVKQAGGHFSTHNLMSNPVQHRESIELWDKNIEKFAELIVKDITASLREIAKHQEVTGSESVSYSLRQIAGGVELQYGIKTHFGVEK